MGSTTPSVVMLIEDNRIDRRALDAARSLVKSGWKAAIIAGTAPSPGYREDEDNYPEVEISRVSQGRTNALAASLDLESVTRMIERFPNFNYQEIFPCFNHHLVEALSRKADVYVAHDLPQLPAAAMAAAYHQAKLVYDSHELFSEQDHGEPRKTLFTVIERFFAPLADLVITVNKSIAIEMTRRLAIEIPEVILNAPAVNPTAVPVPRTTLLHDELHIPKEKRILLYQGNLGKITRNIETVAQTIPLLHHNDVVLVFMGPDHGGVRELIQIGESQRTLNSRLFIHEAVPQSVLLQYTASADVGIIPYQPIDLNTSYCTPNKLFEFITAGLPIIAQDSVELRRFVSNEGIGINAKLGNPAEAASAINQMFDSDLDVYREQLKLVAPRFTWAHQEGRLINAYNRVIRGEQAGPIHSAGEAIGALRRQDIAGAKQHLLRALLALSELEN